MNRYSNYRKINCDWINEIPSDWNLVRGRFLFNSKKQLNTNLQCKNLLSLTLSGVLNKNYHSSDGLRPENYNTYQIFQKDDLVFKMIDLENVNTSRVGIVHEEGIMSPVYIRHEPNQSKIYPKFAYWFYYDLYKKEIYNSIGSGVRSSMTSSDLLDIEIPIPSIKEQKLISQYLDKKIEEIDYLIKKIRMKIELLKEKKTSLINHYVTKGLDPRVEMVESGLSWIGKIPSHWKKIPLKNIAYMKGRIGWKGLKQDEFLDTGDYYLITGHDIKNDKMNWKDCYHISKERYEESPEIILEEGDLLFTKDGTIGKTLYIESLPKPASLNSHLLVIRPINNSYNSKFLQYMFKSSQFLMYVEHNKTGTTFYGMSQNSMENFKGYFPNLSEQSKIVSYLDEHTHLIDSKILNEQKRISLLNEYYQSLISSAVTGKIKIIQENK